MKTQWSLVQTERHMEITRKKKIKPQMADSKTKDSDLIAVG